MVWNIIWILMIGGAAYVVNKVAKLDKTPKLMLNIFLGIVMLMALLALFGVNLGKL